MLAFPLLVPHFIHGGFPCFRQINVFGKGMWWASPLEHVIDPVGSHAPKPSLEPIGLLFEIQIRSATHEDRHALLHDFARIFVAKALQPGVPIDQWVVNINEAPPALLILDVDDGLRR